MDFVQYRTGTDDEGRRLDKVLRILFPQTPLSSFYGYIRKGLIRINEKKIKQDYHISSGDIIYVARFLELAEREKAEQDKEKKLPPCIFRNEHILVLNKPYDIPVHETASDKGNSLNKIVLSHFNTDTGSLSFTPGPLHRLDRKTTGLIAFSQSIQGARVFSGLIKNHEIKKYYLSIVVGHPSRVLKFTDYLTKDPEVSSTHFHTVHVSEVPDEPSSRRAVTEVRPVAYGSFEGHDVTLVEVRIETGRTHQIRSQCASHGYPLLGDTAYGGIPYGAFFLHAWKLEIPYPNALGLPAVLSAPIPERFLSFIEKYLPSAEKGLYNQ